MSQFVLRQLDDLRDRLRAAGMEVEEDMILEVADVIDGWCSPHVAVREHDWRAIGFTLDPGCGGLKPTDRCERCGEMRYPFDTFPPPAGEGREGSG